MRKGDVRRQLGTSTNTAQIQTCNSGFERNNKTKRIVYREQDVFERTF